MKTKFNKGDKVIADDGIEFIVRGISSTWASAAKMMYCGDNGLYVDEDNLRLSQEVT
jgi:hypothetical protein